MRRESRLCALPARLMGVGLSANGWTCQFDLSKLVMPRAMRKGSNLGIISVAKVSHEVDHTVAWPLEDWHGAGVPGARIQSRQWRTLGKILWK